MKQNNIIAEFLVCEDLPGRVIVVISNSLVYIGFVCILTGTMMNMVMSQPNLFLQHLLSLRRVRCQVPGLFVEIESLLWARTCTYLTPTYWN